ncbi:MAG: MEKHLA domain-containing protein [Verrucomicrobia bacterium]|nr:MEKHLA domain-containing protein [Verrucomicrobiota bacterium]
MQYASPAHSELLLDSFRHWTGRELLGTAERSPTVAQALYQAPFVVVSHNTAPDPIFNYANAAALALFEMTWEQITATPSRASAEPLHQAERARFMARVTTHGFVDDYAGIRISRTGKRFRIQNATVWNILAADGTYHGQAATFAEWTNF